MTLGELNLALDRSAGSHSLATAGQRGPWAPWMVGAVVRGMAAQGCDLQLTEYSGENWQATFFVTGMAHSIVKGSAYEPTPWRVV